MNTKTTVILLAIAVLVAAYILLIDKPWAEPTVEKEPTTTAKPLFDVKQDDVDRIEVTVTGSKHPQRVFEKQGTAWWMREPIEGLANDYQVNPMVKNTVEAKYLKEYDQGNKDRPKDEVSGLGQPTAVVKLLKGDKVLAELSLGARLPTGKGYYVQKGGSDVICETSEDLGSVYTKRLSEYRNKQVLKVETKDVQEVEVAGLANFRLVKSGEDWMIEKPKRGRADKSKAEGVAGQLASLSARDWVDDEPSGYRAYGLDEPRLKVAMKSTRQVPAKVKPGEAYTQPADSQPSTQEQTHVLLVGGSAGDNAYFARLESAPMVFSISDYSVKALSPDLAELREKSVAKIASAKVSKIAASTPGGAMTFTKQDGKWKSADGTECDSAAVDDLIKAGSDLKATDFADAGELVVAADWDKPRAKITFTQQGEPQPVTILIGPASPSGKMVYVRNAAEEAIVAVREEDVAQLLAGPASYRDRAVLSFDRARVRRLEITRPDVGAVTLAHENNKWSMVSPVAAAADADAVRNLLQDLSSLRAKRVMDNTDRARFGLDQPAVSLAVHIPALTSEPNVKVAGQAQATKPAEKAATKPAGKAASKPARRTATKPAGTQAAGEAKTQPAISLEDLLEYQKNLPKTDNDPSGLKKQNPLATKMLEDMIAQRQAEKAGTSTKPADASTKPAGAPVTAPAAEPPPPPTILRLQLAQRDGKTYACRDDGGPIYELDNKVYEDATAEVHDRQIAKFETENVIEVTFGSDGRDLTFRKSGEDWRYAADPVLPIDKEKVKEAINDFRDLKTHRYVAYAATDLARFGLDKPAGRVAIAPQGGSRIEILVSATGPAGDADNSRYAMLAGAKKVCLLKKDQVDKCIRKLEAFEKK